MTQDVSLATLALLLYVIIRLCLHAHIEIAREIFSENTNVLTKHLPENFLVVYEIALRIISLKIFLLNTFFFCFYWLLV